MIEEREGLLEENKEQMRKVCVCVGGGGAAAGRVQCRVCVYVCVSPGSAVGVRVSRERQALRGRVKERRQFCRWSPHLPPLNPRTPYLLPPLPRFFSQSTEKRAANDVMMAELLARRQVEEEEVRRCEAQQAANDKELADLDQALSAASASRHTSEKEQREKDVVDELKRYYPGGWPPLSLLGACCLFCPPSPLPPGAPGRTLSGTCVHPPLPSRPSLRLPLFALSPPPPAPHALWPVQASMAA